MSDNLATWNKFSRVPPSFLKPITSGTLKGKSDINPQWRLMAMTQAFGMVGHGWTYRIVRTWSEQSTALSKDRQSQDPTAMVFVEIAVKTKVDGEWGEEFSGIGGSQIVQQFNSYAQANDEGYKMALTDALSVAFKAVGIAADIYFGNYDGSKYKFDYSQAYIENTPVAKALIQQGAQMVSVKQLPTLNDERFAGAINAVKNGTYDKAQLLNGFSLTDAQRAQVVGL